MPIWRMGLQVVDVSNPADPIEAASYDNLNYTDGVAILGSFVTLADQSGGMIILNFTGVRNDSFPTITSDHPNSSLVGEPFTVRVEVDSEFGIPSGEVTVIVAGEDINCSVPLLDGTGSCQLTLDEPGTYLLTAVFSGDKYFLPGTGTGTHITVLNLPKMFYIPLVGGISRP